MNAAEGQNSGTGIEEMGQRITGGTEEQKRQERQSIPGGTGQSMRGGANILEEIERNGAVRSDGTFLSRKFENLRFNALKCMPIVFHPVFSGNTPQGSRKNPCRKKQHGRRRKLYFHVDIRLSQTTGV